MQKVLELVSYVAINLVDHPDEVRIRCLQQGSGVLFEVHVHPEDQGKMIGKGGQTANALRTLLDVVGARAGCAYTLEIADSDEDAPQAEETATVEAEAEADAEAEAN